MWHMYVYIYICRRYVFGNIYIYAHYGISLYYIYRFDLIYEKSRKTDINLKIWRIRWGTIQGHYLNLIVIFGSSYFETI
jgi:hypothetical protein